MSADGTISALSKGDATVTVTTYNGKTADCLVHVVDAPRSVTLATPDGRSTYGVSEKVQLKWELDGCEGRVKFATSNSRIAIVSAAGLVTFKKTGKVTIKVTAYNGVTASLALTGKTAPKSISLGAMRTQLGLGETAQLKASFPSGSTGSYTFTSSAPEIISVDGVTATALKAGSATLTVAAYNGKKASRTVAVLPAPGIRFTEPERCDHR